jgi:hypothetical protein
MPKLSSLRRYIYAFWETFFFFGFIYLFGRPTGRAFMLHRRFSFGTFSSFPVANPNLCRDTLHTSRILSSIVAAINIQTPYIRYRAPQE